MKSIPRISLIVALIVMTSPAYAQDSAAEKAAQDAKVKARLAEHTRPKSESTSAGKKSEPASDPAENSDPVTLMEEVVVSNSRVTALDVQVRKLDKKIKRAKKKLKPSELDETLNSDKIPAALLIFGGKTAGQRKSVAAERVNLMEAERDIIEALKHVRTKKDEDELNTQLHAFQTMQRQLDEVLR
jgi:hypothetical protein